MQRTTTTTSKVPRRAGTDASTATTLTSPGVTPVRRPAGEIVATAELVVDQVIGGVLEPVRLKASVWVRITSPELGETVTIGVGLIVSVPLLVVAFGVPSLKVRFVSVNALLAPVSCAG